MVVAPQTDAAALGLKIGTTKQLANKLAHQGHAGLSAYQDDLIEILGLQFGVGQRPQAMRARARDDIARQALKFCASEFIGEAEGGCQKWERELDGGFR